MHYKSIEPAFADLTPQLRGKYGKEPARLLALLRPRNETSLVAREKIDISFNNLSGGLNHCAAD